MSHRHSQYRSHRRPRRRSALPSLVAAGAAVALGAWMVHGGAHTTSPPTPAAAEAFAPPSGTAAPGTSPAILPSAPPGAPVVAATAYSSPTRIRIPAIGVDAAITGVDLDDSGRLVPPDDGREPVGWYRESAGPGNTGNSVLVGHVDTGRGPAVFYSLGALHKGDTIEIARADLSRARYTVDAVEVYPNDRFPTERVHGATTRPELRVITCGGGYSKATGYRGNVVVYGHLTEFLPVHA
ncbi:class F sortase [Kitasatospora sp. NPDC051853]|uniref:class F sortase n=1 Tax=Kitasatospora sp. NPDC051853 TaxID=3364058 RepID=UPI0037973ECC